MQFPAHYNRAHCVGGPLEMLVPLAGALEGALVGLGFSVLVDVALFGNSGLLFIVLITLAGALAGLIAGYFLSGVIQEDPTTILVAQLAAAVIVAIVVLAFFVLARQSPQPRVLLLVAIWGSFPGAIVGMFLTTTKRTPGTLQRWDRRPTPPPVPAMIQGPASAKEDRWNPGITAAPTYERTSVAPRETRDTLLAILQRQIVELRESRGIEPQVMALGGDQAGSLCLIVRLTNSSGARFVLYLTYAPNYPQSAPDLILSEVDPRSGEEAETPFRSQLLRFWNPTRGLKDIVDEVLQVLR